jgi:hypothetical protein
LWLSALFLRHESYEYQRDRRNPFAHGLLFVIVLGVILALFGIAGSGLRYATAPRSEAIKNVVLTHLQAMPFYENFSSAQQQQFDRGYNQWWEQYGDTFAGYPTDAAGFARSLATVVTTPIGLAIGWLIYGLLAHLIARSASPHTSLPEGLAALALATSPQLLNVISFLPSAGVSGVTVALWTLLCNFVALRTAYRLSTGRAVGATLFPYLLALLIVLLLLCIGFLAIVGLVRGGQR